MLSIQGLKSSPQKSTVGLFVVTAAEKNLEVANLEALCNLFPRLRLTMHAVRERINFQKEKKKENYGRRVNFFVL
jgi:hypothetical protein